MALNEPERRGEPKRVTVEIYGETYTIRGATADETYVKQVAARVDRRMRELAQRMPQLDVTRLAVLTALNLADELTRLQEQYRLLLDRFTVRLGELEAAAGAPARAGASGGRGARPGHHARS